MSIRLARIAVHPVKSTAVRPVGQATVEPWGLRGDRRWMLVLPDGECLTAREDHALLTLIADTPDTDEGLPSSLRLRSPGREEILVPEPQGDPVPVTVHGRALTAAEAGAEAHAWVRGALGRDDVRLVHVAAPRPLNPAHSDPGDATAFADGYPVTLATTASLARLQDWVAELALERGEEPLTLAMERFRPNLVVDGDLEPFEEDGWSFVRVGAVTFGVAKPVDRCVMTTLDPTTGSGGHEPIRTLARHRRWEGATWFAVQLVPRTGGAVRTGDEVVPSR